MNVTTKEMIVMKVIADNEYGDEMTDEKWTWSISNDLSSDIPASSLGGIISSLSKKGLVSVDSVEMNGAESTMSLTDEAAEILIEKYGYKESGWYFEKYENNN